jgi:hypothetical protein
MKRYLLSPLWVVQLFTQTKSFTKNPVIGSRLANRLGLHVARMVVAHAIMGLRMRLLGRKVDPQLREQWHRDGYMLIENFLDDVSFAALRREVASADADVRECIQGDTLTHRIHLDHSTLESMPAFKSALDAPRLQRLLKFASGKNVRPIPYIQTIKNGYVDGPVDPQKHLHSDTFHPTMKSWFFLDKVDQRNGPFTYVPGSHRLTLARLKWEYAKSIDISSGADKYSGNGSLRLTDEDAQRMGFPAPKAFSVPANTLVVANTHGFHCRGRASQKSTRTELWTISRGNPFNPSPGLDLQWFDKLQNHVLAEWRRYQDRRAQATASLSSWHLIEARNTVQEVARAHTNDESVASLSVPQPDSQPDPHSDPHSGIDELRRAA